MRQLKRSPSVHMNQIKNRRRKIIIRDKGQSFLFCQMTSLTMEILLSTRIKTYSDSIVALLHMTNQIYYATKGH